MGQEYSKRGQEANPAEQEMLSICQIGENMPGGFFVYRADGEEELIYVNDVVLDIFGCETVEQFRYLTGFTFKGLVHPDDLETVKKAIDAQVAESNRKLDYVEYRIIRRDGVVRWVDDYGRFVQTKKYGNVYFVLIRDITEIHLAREENRRKAEVIEGLSRDFTSIYLLDLDSGSMRPYRQQSKYFSELAGNDENTDYRSILPGYAQKYVLSEDRELYLREINEQRIKERLDAEQSYSVNYRCVALDGTISYMEMSIVQIQRDFLHHHAVMGYRDVTEQTIRVQRELAEKLNMEMELEQEKHANEIKSSFLFNISHDIRTPMNAIMGFTDLAKRHMDEPDKLKDYLGKVDESNHHMLALIDDLLEMSSIDYGRIEVKAEPCNLTEQLEIVMDMFRARTEEKQLRMEQEIKLPDQDVCVDALRFRRIMGNLIGNAVKFTPVHGNIKITAEQKQVSDSGYARFEFAVSDNGVGMTEEFMKRMYEAFEREETSTKTGYIGTGLGLAITKKLLDVMGGSISVTSKKGEGSTFTIHLPLKLADHVARQAEEAVSNDNVSKASGEHRILLVEDIEINRLLAENILTESGFLVESVPDGSDAVEAVKNHPLWYYDLVLMDIQMPVMNGYEATRSIRAMGREDTDTIPIIALSANARDEDKRMSIESGMNSHVAKPFDIAHLIRTVNEQIEARKL